MSFALRKFSLSITAGYRDNFDEQESLMYYEAIQASRYYLYSVPVQKDVTKVPLNVQYFL